MARGTNPDLLDRRRMGPRLLVSAGLVWLTTEQVLLQRRSPAAAHGAGALEFPGGKVEPGEHPRGALVRELAEEWGDEATALRVGPVADVLHHVYVEPAREVVLCLYHVDGGAWARQWKARIRLETGASALAVSVHALPIDEFLAADQPYARQLRDGRVRSPF